MPLSHGLIENVSLAFPGLPPGMEKVRIAHVSDLHVTRSNRGRWRQLVRQLAGVRLDLVVLTGDYQARDRHGGAAIEMLSQLCDAVKPAHGFFGVFGNHDSPDFIDAARDLPVRWLINDAVDVEALPLRIAGFHTNRRRGGWDGVAVARAMDALEQKALAAAKRAQRKKGGAPSKDAPSAVSISPNGAASKKHDAAVQTMMPPPAPEVVGKPAVITHRLKLLLAHYPTVLPIAADLGFDLVLAGHSHGGQIRMPFAKALVNSMDWPLHLTSGLVRHRDTICAITRGVGENGLPLRLFCPPHVPLISFQRGPLPGMRTDDVQMLQAW